MIQITKIEQLGQLTRAARKSQGLTQAQLSAVAGVGIRFIRELEQGKQSCHIGKVFLILSMLGLELKIDNEN